MPTSLAVLDSLPQHHVAAALAMDRHGSRRQDMQAVLKRRAAASTPPCSS